jgi:translation initiation factor IF-2
MSEENTKKEPLTVARPNRLELTKTVESGKVKQNFQHGRSKTVTVEVRKTRTFTSNDGGRMVELKKPAATLHEQAEKSLFGKDGKENASEDDINLTEEERQSRLRALEHSKTRPDADIPQPATRAQHNANAMIYDKKPLKEIVFDEETQSKSRTDAKLNIAKPTQAKLPVKPATADAEEEVRSERTEAKPASKMKLRRPDEVRRNSGKITVSQALSMSEERVRSMASLRRQREKAKRMETGAGGAQEKIIREVIIPEAITVQELGHHGYGQPENRC